MNRNARAEALEALENEAIRRQALATFNPVFGSVSLLTAVTLLLVLPSPLAILRGQWSSTILSIVAVLAGEELHVDCLPKRHISCSN